MCYQIPGSITKDGQPIVGGLDIDPSDFSFAQSIYPKVITGFSLKKNSEASAVDSVDEAEGATVLEFSHGELTRITLKHSASNS